MPWEVDEVPEEWVNAICGLVDELPGMTAMVKRQEQARSEWLSRNGYRSYLKKA